MQVKAEIMSVGKVLELEQSRMLNPNPEYQRGGVWDEPRKKRFIDSVLRGYPIPFFYFHHVRRQVGQYNRDDFDIVDGQQRIRALKDFRNDGFALFDPKVDSASARFPRFIENQDCPWGGKKYSALDEDLRKRFLDTELHVGVIEADDNHVRDLFIRLQAGMPLTSQEKRDAWPGDFTHFIFTLAGRGARGAEAGTTGRDFFEYYVKGRTKDRGRQRQLAAQIVMLLTSKSSRNGPEFCTVKAANIDAFYYQNIDWYSTSGEMANRVRSLFDKLECILRDGDRKRLEGHEAVHLALLVDTLMQGYAGEWARHVASAFDTFRKNLAADTKRQEGDFWSQYGMWTRTNTDDGTTIGRRHSFFMKKMLKQLIPHIRRKDPARQFSSIDREIIWYRDKVCAVCKQPVGWSDADIHHVEPHREGGSTTLENGVLVHRECHPKGPTAEAELRQRLRERR